MQSQTCSLHLTFCERFSIWTAVFQLQECVVCRLDAPFGTEDKPVEVTSSFSERIVGVPDPYDDSIIWWGHIEEGQPPKQLVEGGEFFVLKRVGGDSHAH